MAKQIGSIRITGTIDGICFYRREGEWLARQASSMTRKRFFRDKAFEGSRRSAMLLKEASVLSSVFYRLLPNEKKCRELFREIVGKVKMKLKQGEDARVIKQWFLKVYLGYQRIVDNIKKPRHKTIQCFRPTLSVQSSVTRLPDLKYCEARSHIIYRKNRFIMRI